MMKSQALIAKLGALTSHYRAERLWRDIHVTNRVKSMNDSLYAQVDTLSLAMQNNCQIEITYMWWTIDCAGPSVAVKSVITSAGVYFDKNPLADCTMQPASGFWGI